MFNSGIPGKVEQEKFDLKSPDLNLTPLSSSHFSLLANLEVLSMTGLRGEGTEKLKADSRCVFSEHTRDVEELETRL